MPFQALSLYYVYFKKVLLSAFLIISINISAHAQSKNFFINKSEPSWIVKKDSKGARPSDKDISDGYYLSVFESQNHIELQEEYVHVVRDIVSDAGVQNGSQISVTYDPSFQKLTFHKIILWRNDKASDRLVRQNFKILQKEKELSKFIYSGTFDAFLLLEDVRKGDKIEYAYTLKGDNPIFGNKLASQFYFEGSSSMGYVYTNVTVNKNRSIDVKNFNFDTPPKISELNGLILYEWESTLTKTHRVADYEPSWYNPLRSVQLTEYKSWNEVVNWGLSVNDYPDLNAPLLSAKVKELKEKAGGDEKKYIEFATRFVQDEIRYMGIEMGVYSHRPNSPEKVLKQRYGDCKDKSLLLVHLLNALDINAWMVYADTYTTIKTNGFLPSPFIFNHVIVLIEYKNRKIWIDPTISFQRGKLDDFYVPNYGYALVLKPGVNALEKIESKYKGKLASHLTFNIADTLEGKVSTLQVKSTYTHNYADNIRTEITGSGVDGLEKDYLEYYGRYYTNIETKDPIKINDNETQNSIEITESYKIEDIWISENENDTKYVYFYGDLISNDLRKIKAKARLEPLSMKYPINLEQTISINMPYRYKSESETVKIDNDNYYFELKRNSKGNFASFKFTFKSLTSYIEGSEIKKYVKDYKKIDENLSFYMTAGNSISDVNSYAVLIFVLSCVFSSLLFLKIYRQSNGFDVEVLAAARPIGGWLILLAIRVVLGPFTIFCKLIMLDLFNPKFWDSLSSDNSVKEIFHLTAYGIAIVAYAGLFMFSLVSISLFFKRRETFPKLYILFTKCMIAAVVFTAVLSISESNTLNALYHNIGYQIGMISVSVVVSLICIWYLKKSKRVKETFVFTYPEYEWTRALIQYYNSKLRSKESPAISNIAADENNNNHENI